MCVSLSSIQTYPLIYSLNLIALSEGFYRCLRGRTFIYVRLFDLTPRHVILSSTFLGKHGMFFYIVIIFNHRSGGKLGGKGSFECFMKEKVLQQSLHCCNRQWGEESHSAGIQMRLFRVGTVGIFLTENTNALPVFIWQAGNQSQSTPRAVPNCWLEIHCYYYSRWSICRAIYQHLWEEVNGKKTAGLEILPYEMEYHGVVYVKKWSCVSSALTLFLRVGKDIKEITAVINMSLMNIHSHSHSHL